MTKYKHKLSGAKYIAVKATNQGVKFRNSNTGVISEFTNYQIELLLEECNG